MVFRCVRDSTITRREKEKNNNKNREFRFKVVPVLGPSFKTLVYKTERARYIRVVDAINRLPVGKTLKYIAMISE